MDSKEIIRKEATELSEKYKLPIDRVARILKGTFREKPFHYFSEWTKAHSEPAQENEFQSIFVPSLREALEIVSPDEAFYLFEREDPARLADRIDLTLSFSFNPWFYSLDELADATEAFIAYMEENRDNLLGSGYPFKLFSLGAGFNDLFGNLYPIVMPFEEQMLDVKIPLNGLNITVSKDNLLDGLTPETAKRIVGLREKVFSAKLEIFNMAIVCLTRKTAQDFWDKCLKILVDVFPASDMEFLLEMDRDVYSNSPLAGSEKTENECLVSSGGMTELIKFIGHVEKEMTIGTQARTREILGEIYQPLIESPPCLIYGSDFSAYFEQVKRGHGKRVDQAIDAFIELDAKEPPFWRDFGIRVNEALENDFYAEVVNKTKVRRKHVELFEPLFRTFAEFHSNYLNIMGALPRIQEGKGPEPQSIFRKRGHFWEISYQGSNAIHIKDRNGMEFISRLLAHPYQEIKAFDLRNLQDVFKRIGSEDDDEENEGETEKTEEELAEEERQYFERSRDTPTGMEEIAGISYEEMGAYGISGGESSDDEEDHEHHDEPKEYHKDGSIFCSPSGTGADSDYKAVGSYIARIKELEDDLQQTTDPEKKHELEREREQIKKIMRFGIGKSLKARPQNDPTEQARKYVSKEIHACFDTIDKENSKLALHLQKGINIGYKLSYTPESPIKWIVRL